jgi:hypothetical protein
MHGSFLIVQGKEPGRVGAGLTDPFAGRYGSAFYKRCGNKRWLAYEQNSR